MTLVAVVGDGCTTTSVGLAAAWPVDDPCMVAELDPAGGCLAAWLDIPRSPGLAEVVASSRPRSWDDVTSKMQRTQSGIDVLVAPTRAVEAAAVVSAASTAVLPMLAAQQSTVVIADGGRLRGALSALVTNAGVVVVAHRQNSGSAAAAALGLERIAELTSQLAIRSIPTIVALIGARPYAADEVAQFVRADTVVEIADDPWAAAVLAGRAGSTLRLRRSPLMRSLVVLAGAVSATSRQMTVHKTWQTPVDEPSMGGRS